MVVFDGAGKRYRSLRGREVRALDGVSLTVNAVEGETFTVNLIPHTAAVTTLDGIAPGRRLNIEIDILARYLARMMDLRHTMA